MTFDKKNLPPGFCIIPWIHMHLSANGDVYSCIEATSAGNPFGNIKEARFEEIFNSEAIKKLRQDMLSGSLPIQCKKCHMQEDFGKLSRRLQNNYDFSQDILLIDEMAEDGTLSEMKLRYMDFRFSNICNLRCKMCMPQNSSSLYEDFEKVYGPQVLPKNIRLAADHPEVFQMTLEQLKNVKTIYFAGGEPLLMDEHYRILEELIRLGRNEEVLIAYNTNFTRLNHGKKDVLSLWKKFPKLHLYVSVDGVGEQLAYLRKGAVWEELLQNRERVRSEAPHAKVVATPVLSAMNGLRVVELFKALVSSNFIEVDDFLLYFLYEPEFFSVHILPKDIKEEIKTQLEGLLKTLRKILSPNCHTINSLSSAINLLSAEDHTRLLPEFQKYIRDFDRAQETDFLKTFPELARIYQKSPGAL